MSEPLLKVTDLTKEFLRSNQTILTACDKVSFTVEKGQTLGIVGESGSGKSTLVNMLMLLEKPTSGKITYRHQELLSLNKKEIHKLRPQIQMVFQDPKASINPKMKVIDIVTEPLFNYRRLDKKEQRAKAIQLLEMVELSEAYLDRYPIHLSGGQCQRVSIARALALEPEILICDEATSALDVSVQKTVVDLLVRLQKQLEMTLLFISHDLALVESFAHEILVMEKGKVVDHLDNENRMRHSQVPYTKKLMTSVFSLTKIKAQLAAKGN